MGATTYEWVLGHERVLDEPDKWRRWYGDRPCWVFTHRTLPAVPGANIVFVRGDVAPVHEQMADAAGGRNAWVPFANGVSLSIARSQNSAKCAQRGHSTSELTKSY